MEQMNVTQMGKLSAEDLGRWRIISANKELVDNGFPGLSVKEARDAIIDFYRFVGEVMETHGIPSVAAFEITTSDGSIVGMVRGGDDD